MVQWKKCVVGQWESECGLGVQTIKTTNMAKINVSGSGHTQTPHARDTHLMWVLNLNQNPSIFIVSKLTFYQMEKMKNVIIPLSSLAHLLGKALFSQSE